MEAERLTYDDFRALNFVRAILDVTVGAQPAIRSIRIYIRNDKNRVFGDDVGVTQICSVYDPTWFANLISVPIEDRGASLQSDPARQPAGGNGTFTVFSHLPYDDGYVLFEMKNEQVASILRNAITYNRQQVALVDENSKTILSVAQDDPVPKTDSRLPSEDEILLKEPVAGLWSNMADFEIAFALTILKVDAHKDIVTIAYEKRPINSIAGFTYMPQMTVIDSIGLTDIDGLIIPGGNNDEHREELTQLIVNINKANRLLGAICRGPVFLARAGVLSGRYYTTTYTEELTKRLSVEDPFDRTKYKNEDTVVDGNIITAKGNAFIDFGIEIADYFKLFKDKEEKEQSRKQYCPARIKK